MVKKLKIEDQKIDDHFIHFRPACNSSI